MATTVYVGGQPQRLTPKMILGQGGEAVVYKQGTEALKVYLLPTDPAYHGDPIAQQGARDRLDEQQLKLPSFPHGLPSQVVTPHQLAYDQPHNGRIAGYTMRLLEHMEVLLSYTDRRFREQHGIDANMAVELFRKLHALVTGVHQANVVIGDFNDLNVLVSQDHTEPFLVDADSMQFAGFTCRAFTTRFVDPLRCLPDKLLLMSPHGIESDWYAFATMLFQVLLYVYPYGGVHKPDSGPMYRGDSRVLHRISVFSPNVIYPKAAIPLTALPDDLLEYFQSVYDKDRRGTFPIDLLSGLRWTACTTCGILHARNVCPACAATGAIKERVTIRGNVKATSAFRTKGRIIATAFQGDTLRWLYHETGAYRREGDRVLLHGPLDGDLRARIQGDKTALGMGSNLAVLGLDGSRARYQTETLRRFSIFDTNERHSYWIENGRLMRDGAIGPVDIGAVLSNRTLIWVGPRFGFGFYRAGSLTRGLVFDTERPGINDSVPLPVIRGNLIDANATLSDRLAWFMVSVQDAGVVKNFCFVIDAQAHIVATAEAVQGDGSWLGDGIRGRLAIGQSLYAATDTGIVRIGMSGTSATVDREFPDTAPFVDALTLLHAGRGGIYAVSPQEITLLEIR